MHPVFIEQPHSDPPEETEHELLARARAIGSAYTSNALGEDQAHLVAKGIEKVLSQGRNPEGYFTVHWMGVEQKDGRNVLTIEKFSPLKQDKANVAGDWQVVDDIDHAERIVMDVLNNMQPLTECNQDDPFGICAVVQQAAQTVADKSRRTTGDTVIYHPNQQNIVDKSALAKLYTTYASSHIAENRLAVMYRGSGDIEGPFLYSEGEKTNWLGFKPSNWHSSWDCHVEVVELKNDS